MGNIADKSTTSPCFFMKPARFESRANLGKFLIAEPAERRVTPERSLSHPRREIPIYQEFRFSLDFSFPAIAPRVCRFVEESPQKGFDLRFYLRGGGEHQAQKRRFGSVGAGAAATTAIKKLRMILKKLPPSMCIFTSGKVLMSPIKVIDDSTCKALGGGECALYIFALFF